MRIAMMVIGIVLAVLLVLGICVASCGKAKSLVTVSDGKAAPPELLPLRVNLEVLHVEKAGENFIATIKNGDDVRTYLLEDEPPMGKVVVRKYYLLPVSGKSSAAKPKAPKPEAETPKAAEPITQPSVPEPCVPTTNINIICPEGSKVEKVEEKKEGKKK